MSTSKVRERLHAWIDEIDEETWLKFGTMFRIWKTSQEKRFTGTIPMEDS